MRLAVTRVTVANARRDDLAPIAVEALADTGAVHLCIPEHAALKLQLEEHENREVLLGAIPMEDMDVVVAPSTRQVVANPLNPDIAASITKDVR